MSERYPKRLIEVDLPIARISAHARREKSIRHGHISTLHIWWARRPLAACRAVTCAALWPDPADELCPQAFRDTVAEHVMAFARRVMPKKISQEGRELQSEKHLSNEGRKRWEGLLKCEKEGHPLEPADPDQHLVLRGALLDFIADFANWDNSSVPAYLETSRALTQAAHEALGGVPGTRPLVVDPFAGGGSIPLEALRVGADAFASDLNPVAVLLNKVVLEYIPKYGQRLADEVRRCGDWVKDNVEQELGECYPQDSDGAKPIAYLWARTILSEAPGQEDEPVEVPLLRSLWLSKKKGQKAALRWKLLDNGSVETESVTVKYSDGTSRNVRRPLLEIFSPKNDSEVGDGTATRGAATCPVTQFTTPVTSVRAQLKRRRGGSDDARLLCVVTTTPTRTGRSFRLSQPHDFDAYELALKRLRTLDDDCKRFLPTEAISRNELRRISVPIYGIEKWVDAFSGRQLLAIATLSRAVARVGGLFEERDKELSEAVQAVLAIAVSRFTDICNALCMWETTKVQVRHAFTRQAIGMLWDFAEPAIFADAAGNFSVTLGTMLEVLEREAKSNSDPGVIQKASATAHPLPNDSASAVFTDPPYYDAVPYAHLSDFFYVWLRRILSSSLPDLVEDELAPKDQEIVVDRPHQLSTSAKGVEFYESQLKNAFADARRVVRDDGIATIVFASKTTASWEAILQAIVDAGWTITASWPIDTELANRVSAQGQARLGSSIHLVCRSRNDRLDEQRALLIGEWRDILSELPLRIHEWMPRLAAEGVVGADAIFACLGPALEIFSRYSRVEKASGETVVLREYLEQVWATVSTEALSMIFRDANAGGLEPDARLTAMWLWTLGGGTGKAGTNGNAVEVAPGMASENDDKEGPLSKSAPSAGFTLEFDAARKIAQGLGVHLEQSDSIVEVKGDKARLLPVSERLKHLFGKDESATVGRGRKKAKSKQRSLFDELDALEAEAEAEETVHGELKPQAGETVLDRVHQSMILFGSGRGEALRRFLVEDGAGNDARFWKLAQSLSALYPPGTDEKRWVDGVLARKKGLGL